jgi:CheY-like chemotaxis protein
MTVTCPTCKASLSLPDDRLPKGKAVTAACPHCKGKIVIDLTGAAASAPVPPPPESPAAYAEERQPPALVCISAPAEREEVLANLRRAGYAPQVASDAADAIGRLRFTAYALVILRDGFGSAEPDGNPVLDLLAEMAMARRRLMHVVFVSPRVRSHDFTAAFARSMNLVLHVNDLPHLGEALKRSLAETDQTHHLLLESLRALGKG